MTKKTAILIFANSAKEEANANPLQIVLFFETLTNETINKVKQTGLPYFHFTEKQQIGNSFGARFTNAIQSVFDKGFTI